LIVLMVLRMENSAFGQANERTDTKDIDQSLYAALGPVVKNFDGVLMPEMRTAYTSWATNLVMAELSKQGQSVSQDCLAQILSDPILSDAAFRSVYPPDPSILQNFARLRMELDPGLMAKYRSLAIAVAVAKRTEGVQTGQTPDFDALSSKERIQREKYGKSATGDYQPAFWGDEGYLKPAKSQKDKKFIAALADYLRTNHVSALEVYTNVVQQERLKAYLNQNQISSPLTAGIGETVKFGESLKNAMVLLGQRPATREKKPDTVAWLRYLASIYEAIPTSTPNAEGKAMAWPLFPLDHAPWPLLMPLARPVPLGEAKYIWETFQGEHGPDRYHTYGPYRNDEKAMPYELEPSPWFWSAWPDRIVHGGECVPISLGTVDLYSSLGKPAMWAGQPGHANLISFQYHQGLWTAKVEQAYAGGPDVTHAQWYFDDPHGTEPRFRNLYNWAGAEYQLGLALGMNRSLESYMDTRMAAAIFNVLPPDEKLTVGKNLLTSAAAVNPYNPNIWYQLAQMVSDARQGMTLTQAVMRQTPDANGYWKTVDQFVARFAVLAHPAPADQAELARICAVLETVPGIAAQDTKTYRAGH
jgi:hypothetical protein